MIRIALSKGRIFDETVPIFDACGIAPADDLSTRKLILKSTVDDVEFLIVRASDVPTYVNMGAPIWVSPARTYCWNMVVVACWSQWISVSPAAV